MNGVGMNLKIASAICVIACMASCMGDEWDAARGEWEAFRNSYEPDFVVETEGVIYLVEVKGEDKLNDSDVIAKKKRGIQYCEVATRWGKANGYKEWRYLFIPSKQVMPNSSFMQLARQFRHYE